MSIVDPSISVQKNLSPDPSKNSNPATKRGIQISDNMSTKSRKQIIEDELAQELSQFEYETLSQLRDADGSSSFVDIGFTPPPALYKGKRDNKY